MQDAAKWDAFHIRTHEEESLPSGYAVMREKLFPRGSLVVELGGGTGADGLYFIRQGHSVLLLDISEFALKVATDKAAAAGFSDRLAVRQADFGLHEMPIKPSSVDVVYSRISLHYFGSKHTTKLFRDIYNILKPNATAYLTFKSPQDSQEMEYLQNVGVEYEPNVYIENGQLRSRFTTDQLKTMLINAQIPDFQVSSLKEDITPGKEGTHKVLFLNEVVIRKPLQVGV